MRGYLVALALCIIAVLGWTNQAHAQAGYVSNCKIVSTPPVYSPGSYQPETCDLNGNLYTNGSNVTSAAGGLVAGSPPTLTQGTTAPLSLSTSGGLRVTCPDGTCSTLGLSQGAPTAGQLGGLSFGSVTTSAPTYATGTVNGLSLTTSGALRVDSSTGGAGPSNITQFGGNNVVTGTGVSGLGIPRVTVASDSSLSANISQVAGATVATGHGTASGSLRVELPTDGNGVVGAVTSITNALPAGSNTLGNIGVLGMDGATRSSSANPLAVVGPSIVVTGSITTQNLNPTGTATAGSAVEYTVNGATTVGFTVSGTYTGALSEQFLGDCTQATTGWLTKSSATSLFRKSNAAYSTTIPSAAVDTFLADDSGLCKVRITALAAVTGTANISITAVAGNEQPRVGQPQTSILPTASVNQGATLCTSSAVESGHICKATTGNIFWVDVYSSSASPSFLMVFDSATVPADGAVTPLFCFPVVATGAVDRNFTPGPWPHTANGISVALSSTGCFTKTAISNAMFMVGFF